MKTAHICRGIRMDDLDLGVKKIAQPIETGQQGKQKPGDKKKRPERGAAIPESFEELAQTVERVNKVFAGKKSRYRFRIYREHAHVFIDLVLLDDRGDTARAIRKNILLQDFSRIIEHIETMDGVLVDFEA